MKLLKLVFSLLFIFSLTQKANASHVSGGEILYEWVAPNTYNIKLRVFRDCSPGAIALAASVTVGLYVKGTNAQQATFNLNQFTQQTNIDLGDSCYTPTSLCIDERIYFLNNVNIPNNPNGYYLQTNIYSRSNFIDNMQNPGSTSMCFYAEMPDPALGQNSSPDFGEYPADAYLCISNVKTWFYSVSDPDGDSLAFTLVDPLRSTTANGTQVGTGAYPHYPSITWAGGYNLANICGGTPAMNINAVTGEIAAAPIVQGNFVFAVRVEEYRNGVKIGEVRRDVVYASLPCSIDSPPVIDVADTVSVYYGDSICVDLTVYDDDGVDTIYLFPTSIDFDLNGTYIPPTQVGSDFIYTNFNNSGNNAVMSHFVDNSGIYQGVGDIFLRYCWVPECEDVDSTYNINLLAYSLGCSGSDTTQKDIIFSIEHDPIPQVNIDAASDTLEVTYGDQICFDILVDLDFISDTVEVRLNSPNFELEDNYVPTQTLNGESYYTNFFSLDTLFVPELFVIPINQTYTGVGQIPFRFCITPDCDNIDETFLINIEANTIGCGGSDTLYKTYYVDVFYEPTPIEFNLPDSIGVTYDTEICFEMLTNDLTQSGYNLGLKPLGSGFNYQEAYVSPVQGSNGDYYYTNFQGLDTVRIYNYSYSGGEVIGLDTVAIRYCWTPQCDDVVLKNYTLDYTATLYTPCFNLSETKTMQVSVEPPVGEVNPIPNVFTPNGDGQNDFFELSGSNDPCFDEMDITIYNRWGKIVFESTASDFQWNGKNKNDGKDCAEGTYFVIINGSYGSTYNNVTGERIPNPVVKQYSIQLLR